jgi:protein-L-isoaspartate(D-aspartate) O-methyltransferase
MSWEYVLNEDDYRLYRRDIHQLEEQILTNFPELLNAPEILKAIRGVPRHLFVNASYRYMAYTDNAVPTVGDLTSSAPSVIGEMIYHVGIGRAEKLLEIGTGTGYEAAVLSEMGVHVCTIEIDRRVGMKADGILVRTGYKPDRSADDGNRKRDSALRFHEMRRLFPHRGSVSLYLGNGRHGMAAHAPYRGIIVAASIQNLRVIEPLVEQLGMHGGRLVVPVGKRGDQTLHIVERGRGGFKVSVLKGVGFDFIRLVQG